MEKRERVRQLIPPIDQIKNDTLRDGVLGVWVRTWDESQWADISDCPFSAEIPGCDLIQHTNFVINTATAMASLVKSLWGYPIDTDILLAAAALHDVCKLAEIAPEKGKPGKKSLIGESLVHGAYGAHLALDAGIPLEVVHIISCHTPQVSKVPNSLEGVLICYADYAAADIFQLRNKRPLLLGKVSV